MIIKSLLNKINDLTSMSEEGITYLLSCARQEVISKGKLLLMKGQICNDLYFIEEGLLRTYIIKSDEEININFTFEGDFTCDIKSLKTQQPSMCFIESIETSIVTFFDKDAMLSMYSHSSEIEMLCRRILGSILIEGREYIDFCKLLNPRERYNYLLKNKPQMIHRITVSHLSSYIGVARETLSRIRRECHD